MHFPRLTPQIPIQWSRVESWSLHFHKAPDNADVDGPRFHAEKPCTRPPVYKIMEIKHHVHYLAHGLC